MVRLEQCEHVWALQGREQCAGASSSSFFASLEKELIDRRTFRSHAEGRMAVFRSIERWYNPRRRHSGIEYCSPNNNELKHKKAS